MKRCPECRRDYHDDSLLYCLEDGVALVQGSVDEPPTAILRDSSPTSEAATRAQIDTTEQRPSAGFDKRPLLLPLTLAIIVLGGFFAYRYVVTDAGEINSIAVLPFENRTGSADTDYLSDGLADSLIYRLSQLPNLKVSPTSSVMRYKGKDGDTSQIAKELEVDAVMSGRLVQLGDDLSISVQLTDARSHKLIWAEQYDRKMSDLLATQREIATTITQKLQLKLAGADVKGITKKYTDNNEAYQLYLKGRFHFAKRTKDDVLKSIEYFQQAIKLDLNFAIAYARMAEAFNQMPAYPYLSPKEAFPLAEVAAKRAIAIDPTLAEGHAALANTLMAYDWNWTEGEAEYKRALELDPDSSATHFRYGLGIGAAGRLEEGIREVKRALELEPLDLSMNANLAWAYLTARQFDRALDQAKKAYDLDQNFVVGRWNLSQAYIANGMYVEAIALNEQTLVANPTSQFALRDAGYAYAKSGRRREADEMIGRLREIGKTQYVMSCRIASVYGALGEKDKAFAELEMAFENRDWDLHRLKVDPFMDPLRDDPRFKELLRKIGLPE